MGAVERDLEGPAGGSVAREPESSRQIAQAREGRTQVVAEFGTEAPGRTRVRLTHLGWWQVRVARDVAHAADWRSVRAYVARAWPSALAALRSRFEPQATGGR